MISNRNKSLFATVVMAITLARSAPLQDTTTAASSESHLIDGLPEHRIKDVTVELGNHSMHITSPTDVKEHHHHHRSQHHQAQVVPTGEDYAAEISEEIPSNGEELAEHVINLRDYIETLTEDEFEGFLEHYMENGSKDDIFALELALDLDADDRDDEDDFDYSAPFDTEDEQGGIRFVPYNEIQGDRHLHHPQRFHNHRFQHKFEQEVGCNQEEIEMGLCEPSVEFEQHSHHHHSHRHHRQHDINEELSDSHPHHLRHGEVIRGEVYDDASHHHDHKVMLHADGSPFGDSLTHGRHIRYANDADLLGLPQIQHIPHKPLGVSIIEQAIPVAPFAHPVKMAEIHVQEVPSLAPRAVDEVSNKPF